MAYQLLGLLVMFCIFNVSLVRLLTRNDAFGRHFLCNRTAFAHPYMHYKNCNDFFKNKAVFVQKNFVISIFYAINRMTKLFNFNIVSCAMVMLW